MISIAIAHLVFFIFPSWTEFAIVVPLVPSFPITKNEFAYLMCLIAIVSVSASISRVWRAPKVFHFYFLNVIFKNAETKLGILHLPVFLLPFITGATFMVMNPNLTPAAYYWLSMYCDVLYYTDFKDILY